MILHVGKAAVLLYQPEHCREQTWKQPQTPYRAC